MSVQRGLKTRRPTQKTRCVADSYMRTWKTIWESAKESKHLTTKKKAPAHPRLIHALRPNQKKVKISTTPQRGTSSVHVPFPATSANFQVVPGQCLAIIIPSSASPNNSHQSSSHFPESVVPTIRCKHGCLDGELRESLQWCMAVVRDLFDGFNKKSPFRCAIGLLRCPMGVSVPINRNFYLKNKPKT